MSIYLYTHTHKYHEPGGVYNTAPCLSLYAHVWVNVYIYTQRESVYKSVDSVPG